MNKIERANDFQRRQEIIRDLFEGYRQEVLAYAEFMDNWRKRNQKREAA
jgi:hypothetical protein